MQDVPNSFKMRFVCVFSAVIDFNSGAFLSSVSPVYDTNTAGINSVPSFTNAGEVGSHAV